MKNRASGTAEGVAYMRYFESQRPEAQRICNDYLAYKLSAWWVKLAAKICSPFPLAFLDWAMEKKGKGTSGFLAVRTRLFDDFVLEQLKANAKQYVILGAGLDSRAYRFASSALGVKVFEIDHPLSQVQKKERVIKCFGKLPPHVQYVPVDFTKDDLLSCLENAGYDPSLKTVFTFEGVSMYLDERSVKKTLNFILNNSGLGSSVIFDYIYAEALDGRLKSKVTAHMNRLKFIFNESINFGIGIDMVESFIRNIGFGTVEDFPPDKLYDIYLKPCTPNRPISDVYGIAVAYIT
jgi:methyltransferase (TIGR00027 family)